MTSLSNVYIQGCIQKFLDWLPGARTANGTALQLGAVVSLFLWISLLSFAAITLCVASQWVNECLLLLFHYRLSLETLGYTLIFPGSKSNHSNIHFLELQKHLVVLTYFLKQLHTAASIQLDCLEKCSSNLQTWIPYLQSRCPYRTCNL